MILRRIGDLDGALRLNREQESICRRLNDLAGLSGTLGNQAVILMKTADLAGAMLLLKEQEAICRRLNDPNGLATSLYNQAGILAFNRSRPAEGLPLAEEALRLATQHGLITLGRQIEPIVNKIRGLLK